MARMMIIIFATACICASAFPMEPTVPLTRNTIFADEKLEGQIFENIGEFDLLEAARNTVDNSSAFRLPTTTRPRHYTVLWVIDIESRAFSGEVSIELYATQPGVNEIVIQSSEMNLGNIQLYLNNVPINTTVVEEEDTQFLRVQLADNVHTTLQYSESSPVIYTLTISFNAPLRTNMYGIYESWYRNNATDAINWMATTQFQATAARWAFPCYDEPAFKATFDITIRRPIGYKSWTCTRINATNPAISGYEDDVYQSTPIMSTYLLALIVANYDAREHFENGVLMFEVIARPGAMLYNQSEYAFDVGMELLDEMSSHTAMDYYSVHPDLKMTQAAIPDFGAGAMENWGLLTYREAYLMYDEEHTNSYFKQMIAYILSHEIAHMWFGNLVTCDWWDVLWLNEGFARYYQYFLTHWVEDYMGLETRFITEQMHTSLLSDAANNPHPLSTTSIGNRAQVSAMFSTISYNKGAAIIRQTEHLLGFDVHREGLRNYLLNKAFQTALPIDLFEALQNVSVAYNAISEYGSEFNVVDYYKSWTDQPGHPVLNVQVNHQTGEMTIYQRRFNINAGYSAINNNYIVPITFATASNPNFNNTKPTHIIRDAVTTIQRGSVGDEWVIFNKQQTGFYRVNYDDYTWDLIIAALRGPNRSVIHEYNRAQIVNDVFQFARAGLMTYTRAFNILSFLENETEYAPWVAAITGFSWLRNRLAGTTYLADLENLIISWSNTSISQLTYLPLPNESFMTSYLRYQLAPVLCAINAPNCRDWAVAQFADLRNTNQSIEVPVDSRNWVYCNGLREGTTDDFDYLWNRFLQHNVYTEKIQLLMVLGCTPYASSLTIFLNAIVQPNNIIRRQDYTTAWNSAVTGNEANTMIVFNYVQNNLQAVINAFDGDASLPLSYISSRLRTVEQVNTFQLWATSNQGVLGDDYIAVYNGAEASRQSIQWSSEVQNDFNNYFENRDTPVSTSTAAPTVVTPVVTLAPDNLVQPATPALPDRDAAATTYVSMLVLAITVMANFIL